MINVKTYKNGGLSEKRKKWLDKIVCFNLKLKLYTLVPETLH